MCAIKAKHNAENKKINTSNKVDKKAKLPRSTSIGLLEGKVWMSDDFNEPIEEMKEYMNTPIKTNDFVVLK